MQFISNFKFILNNINAIPNARFYFPFFDLLLTSNAHDIFNLAKNKYTRSNASRISLKLTGVGSYVVHDDAKAGEIRQIMTQYLKPSLYLKIVESASIRLISVLEIGLKDNDFIEVKFYEQLRNVFDRVMLEDFLGVIEFAELKKRFSLIKSPPEREERLSMTTFIASLPIPYFLKALCLPTAKAWANYRSFLAVAIYDHSVQFGTRKDSYLDELLKKERCGILNKKDVLGEINSAFDGSNSISTSLTWSILLLAEHGKYQDIIHDTKMARNCYLEALRLYPPFHILSYEPTPKSSPDASQCPYFRAKNLFGRIFPWKMKNAVVSVLGVQRSPAYWVNEDSFFPERWIKGQSQIIKMSYIPFGIGDRACPARALSIVVGSNILKALFLAGFKFSLVGGLPKPKRYYFLSDQEQTVKISLSQRTMESF